MKENPIIQYYDQLAGNYDQDRFNNSYGKFIDRSERSLLNKFVRPNEIVVDLACGSGRLLNFASIGIDASKEMIAIAQAKFPDKKYYLADAEKIPLDDASVDTIIIFHFFMHLNLDKIHKILTECNRILKKNGRIIFDIPSKKRRSILGYKSSDWHGAYSLSFNDLKSITNFKIKETGGLLFIPIHRLPSIIRPLFSKIDSILSNSFLKEYSSYLVIELEKN